MIEKKKREFPTTQSDIAIKNVFETLEETPRFLNTVAKRFDEKTALNPIIEGKRSFRETLVHLLNIEGLNYTTIYPAFLLSKPKIYPLHAERDFDRLSLFGDFKMKDLLLAFHFERKKTLSFLGSLKPNDWNKQLVEDNKARQETIYWRARGLAVHDYTHVYILKFQMDL